MPYYVSERGTLKGFDMVYAVSEATINQNLERLHKGRRLPLTWETGFQGDPGKPPRLKASLGPPIISLPAEAGGSRSVDLHIDLKKGTFWYFESADATPDLQEIDLESADPFTLDDFPQQGKLVEVPIDNWRITLRVHLGLAQIVDEINKKGGKVPDFLKEQLSNLPSRFASIEYLFLDLTNAHLVDMSKVKFLGKISEAAKQAFRENVDAYIQYLKTQPNSLVVGAVASNTKEIGIQPTFKPTGVTFSTSPQGEVRLLNYLLVTERRPLPTDPAAGLFDPKWIPDPQLKDENPPAGVFVISRPVLFYPLLRKLSDSVPYFSLLWLKPTNDSQGRSAMGVVHDYPSSLHFSGFVTPFGRKGTGGRMECCVDISWKLKKYIDVYLKHIAEGLRDFRITVDVSFATEGKLDFHPGGSSSGTNPSSILQFVTAPDKTFFTRSAISDVDNKPIDISDQRLQEMGDYARVAQQVHSQYQLLGANLRDKIIDAVVDSELQIKKAVLKTNIHFPVDQLQLAVILPAGRNLNFTSPRFDREFNLLVNTTYA